jgi:hypothetical protein
MNKIYNSILGKTIKIGEEKFGIESDKVILNNKLEKLPKSIGKLTALEELDLANNNLKALPKSIGKLTNLKILNLEGNGLTELPESIGKLTALENLDLVNNNLKALPKSIGKLTNLKILKLDGNGLTELPESIGKLTALETFDLYMNELRELPESIEKLTALETLNLYGNGLTELPETIGNLTNLKTLDLYGNELTKLPESIGNLTNLETLDLYANELTELPESIENLMKSNMSIDVGYNKLIHMPKIPLEYFHCLDNVSSNYETLKTLPDGYIDWYRKNKVEEHLHEKFLEKIDKGEIKEDVISVVKTAIAPVTRYKYGRTVRQPKSAKRILDDSDENKTTIGDLPDDVMYSVFSFLKKGGKRTKKNSGKYNRKTMRIKK